MELRLHKLPARMMAVAICLAGLSACDDRGRGGSSKSATQPSHSDQDHDHDDDPHHHTHAAPHGGTIVELENEVANLEVLLDSESGTLTAWVFDGCMDRSIRLKQEEIELVLRLPGGDGQGESVFARKLSASANPLTGETVGDASQFVLTCADLKGVTRFKGVLSIIAVRTAEYRDIAFDYPGASTVAKDHAGENHEHAGSKEAPRTR